MSEQSPLDLLKEVHTMLSDLGSRMTLVEKVLGLIQNKVNAGPTSNFQASAPEPVQAKIANVEEDLEKYQKRRKSYIMPSSPRVYGVVYNPQKQPIYGVVVKISDANNKVLTTTKTNSTGAWEATLNPGKYTIKFSKEGMPASYRLVTVEEGQNEVEVV